MPSSAPRTVLRIKRPRGIDPLPTLQFTGKKRARTVDDIAAQLATSNISSDNAVGPLIWKRVDGTDTTPKSNKRPIKFVDATLDQVTDKSKRQRLALTLQKSSEASPSPKKRSKHAILDPLSRVINDRLGKVQEGSATLQHFIDFIESDERVCHDPERYISWLLADGNNVLHMAALWNSVEEARHILLRYAGIIHVDAFNADGQSPYQIAKMAGNEQMAQLLEAFGADTNDYVYDVFEIAAGVADEDEGYKEATIVELRGGIGYLDEHGELILEALCPEDYGANSDDEALNAVDDEDSNAEDHEFNDYPDEEESVEEDEEVDYRHRALYLSQNAVPVINNQVYSDDVDAEYDSQYGLYDGEMDDQRLYAYDPNYDE